MSRNEFPQNGFEAWGGYMQAKITKLEEQFSSKVSRENQISNLFNGISIYVNGYTKPSADELKLLMSKHGGIYHTYQRSNDFIIASNLPDTKVKNHNLSIVVKPDWITESIVANRLLDYKNYLLYGTSRTQPKLNFGSMVKSEVSSTTITTDSITNLSTSSCTTIQADFKMDHDKIVVQPADNIMETKQYVNNQNILVNVNPQSESKGTAVDPNFISDFYNNSRLHHISQLGACFKQYINELRDTSDFVYPARIQFKNTILQSEYYTQNDARLIEFEGGKVIMHIDMDCFFVSVGLRKRPELRGRPVAVTHARTGQQKAGKRPGVDRAAEFNLYKQKIADSLNKATGISMKCDIETRVDHITDEDDMYGSMSEIASCSYEARAKGISNGMFMGAALKLCPDIQTIPYDFEGYKEVAYTLYNTISQYTLDIEAVSCDEMYVDCTELLKFLEVNVEVFANVLRNEIRNKTGCPCSAGFGGNRLQARLATKRAKPDGQFFLTVELVNDFMFEIKLRDLPGVGRQTSQRLEVLGHQTCGSLQTLPLNILQHHLGSKTGALLYDQCRGKDSNPLQFHSVRKSVSAEVNYGIRFENNEQCTKFLMQLSAEVHSRMLQFKVTGKCITLKLMVRAEEAPVETAKFLGHGFCNVINKSITLLAPTNDLQVITREVLEICKKQKVDPKEMRGIGIQITKLESTITKARTGAMSKFLTMKGQEAHCTIRNSTLANNLDKKIKLEKTPPKSLVSPQKKRSPISSSKSPIKKRTRKLKFQATNTPNVMNKFLQGNISKNESVQETVRNEIKISNENKNSEPLNDNFEDDLYNLPWDTVRDMLRAWIVASLPPMQCDIIFLSRYLTKMIMQKKIDKVKILMNFLRRNTKETESSEWLDVYNHIVNEVQNSMIAVYGKLLLLTD